MDWDKQSDGFIINFYYKFFSSLIKPTEIYSMHKIVKHISPVTEIRQKLNVENLDHKNLFIHGDIVKGLKKTFSLLSLNTHHDGDLVRLVPAGQVGLVDTHEVSPRGLVGERGRRAHRVNVYGKRNKNDVTRLVDLSRSREGKRSYIFIT